MSMKIYGLEDSGVNFDVCGNKGANLSQLIRAGANVPAGFIVSADFLQARFPVEIHDRIPPEVFERRKIQDAQKAIKQISFPNASEMNLIRETLSNYSLNERTEVIARSSGITEDTGIAAFAGIFESIRTVGEPSAVAKAIRDVYSSRFTDTAYLYAARLREMGSLEVPLFQPLAVIVQKCIPYQFGGVLFTENPMKQNHGILEFSLDGPESVVNGSGNIQSFVFSLEKGVMALGDDSEFRNSLPLEELRNQFLNSLEEQLEIVQTVFTGPQDVEWLWDGYKAWTLQARPIT